MTEAADKHRLIQIVAPGAALLHANPGTCAETVFLVNQAATLMTVIMMSDRADAGAAGGVVTGVFNGRSNLRSAVRW